MATPVPIPNTAVKRSCGDDSLNGESSLPPEQRIQMIEYEIILDEQLQNVLRSFYAYAIIR